MSCVHQNCLFYYLSNLVKNLKKNNLSFGQSLTLDMKLEMIQALGKLNRT